jgi:uncharacterized protein (DUF2336 family)
VPSGGVEIISHEPVLLLRDSIQTTPLLRTQIEVTSLGITLEEEGLSTTISYEDTEAYQDIAEEVRVQIARKIAILTPTLAENDRSFLLSHAVRVLQTLAEDQAARVRRLIAEELKDSYHAPHEIIRQLAWDKASEVAEPVLEYSPLLSDLELIDILTTTHLPWVVEAISRRRSISPLVSDAIIMAEHDPAITNLLANDSITLSAEGIEDIISLAPEREHWHIPLVCRHELTANTINRIAEFVSHTIFRKLEEEQRIPAKNLSELKQAVHLRLRDRGWDRKRTAEILAEDLFYRGLLNAERVMQAIEERDDEFVYFSLALMANCSYTQVRAAIATAEAKLVTSLCWQAGLSMRDAIQVQLRIAKIHHTHALYAKEGVEYPLATPEMQKIINKFLENNKL